MFILVKVYKPVNKNDQVFLYCDSYIVYLIDTDRVMFFSSAINYYIKYDDELFHASMRYLSSDILSSSKSIPCISIFLSKCLGYSNI